MKKCLYFLLHRLNQKLSYTFANRCETLWHFQYYFFKEKLYFFSEFLFNVVFSIILSFPIKFSFYLFLGGSSGHFNPRVERREQLATGNGSRDEKQLYGDSVVLLVFELHKLWNRLATVLQLWPPGLSRYVLFLLSWTGYNSVFRGQQESGHWRRGLHVGRICRWHELDCSDMVLSIFHTKLFIHQILCHP